MVSACAGPSASSVPTATTPPPAGVWRNLGPAGSLPATRDAPGLAYDVADGRVILFAGKGRDYDNDTWAYAAAANTWSNLHPAGSLPPARFGHAMDYSSAVGRVVVFGGALEATGLPANDTWTFDAAGDAWSQAHPAVSPSARLYPSMVDDPTTGMVVLFGGWTGSSALGDTWTYDARTDTWADRKPTAAPPPRWGAAMAFEPTADRVILFGGLSASYDGSTRFGDTWEYDTVANTWTQLQPTGDLPPSRGYATMAWDPAASRAVLFGGFAGGSNLLGDTWAYDPTAASWTHHHPPRTSPAVRDFHSMVYDSTGKDILLFGGLTGTTGNLNGTLLNDIWAFGTTLGQGQ
jgi:N-acetylneuraminic acid mutarotase